jgi:transcriptional regulator with XRE-family HTH domain
VGTSSPAPTRSHAAAAELSGATTLAGNCSAVATIFLVQADYAHIMRISMVTRKRRRRSNMEIALDLQRWMRKCDYTQQDVAGKLRVNQSRISRILAGDFVRGSKSADRLCALARVPLYSPKSSSRVGRRLLAAFYDSWDGTEADREKLLSLLKTAACPKLK